LDCPSPLGKHESPPCHHRKSQMDLIFSIVLSYLCLFVQDIIVLYFCCVCLRLVCPMLPVSLYCPFLIAPSVFTNVFIRVMHGNDLLDSRLKTQDCITLIHCCKRQITWFHCVNVYSLIMSISDVDFLHLSYQAKFKRKKLHYKYLCWQGVEIKLFWGGILYWCMTFK
jgi:hypothetical protein